jgi:tyrosyl-tRNA synthetase
MTLLKVSGGWSVIDAFLGLGFVSSKSEARRLLKQGAIAIDDVPIRGFFDPCIIHLFISTEDGLCRERWVIEKSKLYELCKIKEE